MRRRRKVTITKVRRQTVTVTTTALLVWCPFCNREVETLSEVDATVMLRLAGRMLDSAVTSGRIHLIETGSGSSRVCKDSLFAE
jgi:NMD protein affecting ribosome stability and mRNA decay